MASYQVTIRRLTLAPSIMMKPSLGIKGCFILVEGSKMPCTPDAVDVLRKADVLIAPSVAAGIGGVVAGEYELKETYVNWSPEDFESKLQEAMKQTYQRALKTATDFGYVKENPEWYTELSSPRF